ncbi:MAG: DHH family phosphoesterase [Candidatus Poseidoniaceae archaeon]|jgi:nanoRNase/pAp phosphatase (c-di-AMP/oligoRNAs hydrolase)|nr:DHH family phosphoesterase [Candidatus Poseidoniaceae archaeon]
MFLVFGSNHLAVRLSKWCANRHRCVLVGLASTLPVEEPLEGCEIIALPSPLKLDSIPLIGHIPTAILYLDNNALKDENPLEEIKIKWPDTPILTTIPLEGDGIDLVSIDDISFAAMQDRIRSWERRTSASVVKAYLKAIPKGSKVAIFCHDNPDPDALASGLAMLKLVEKIGLEGSILHGGLIEHQQNRAMVQLLEIPTRRLILDWEVADIIADSQVVITVDFHKPGANNILPVDCIPNIVIDHHTVEDSVAADIVLVRSEFSSTSSLITSLLMSLNHQIDIKTATALAFGIKTDTLGFTRDFNAVDLRALSWLNAFVDKDVMRSIEIPPRSQETLEAFSNALNSRIKFGNTILAPLMEMPNRDSLAQIADFLLPTEGIDTVVVFGVRRGKVIISARTKRTDIHIGKIFSSHWTDGLAGGHRELAGGQIPFEVILTEVPDDLEKASLMAIEQITEQLKLLLPQ